MGGFSYFLLDDWWFCIRFFLGDPVSHWLSLFWWHILIFYSLKAEIWDSSLGVSLFIDHVPYISQFPEFKTYLG